MVSFESDEEVESLRPGESTEELAMLLGLLCGQVIRADELSSEARLSIESFLRRVRSNGDARIRIRYEEFNELLLLFNQYRVERPFFDFFFGLRDPINRKTAAQAAFVTFRGLKNGVKHFRGFAMLCFGNFRFAFRRLSEEKNAERFVRFLEPWNRDSKKEEKEIGQRQDPLLPLTGTADEIASNKTWFLGYLSADSLKTDAQTLERLSERPGKSAKTLERALSKLSGLNSELQNERDKGKRNSVKYLTWDYLDIYVATSMRQLWEFEETYNFIKKVFTDHLSDIPKIRWFDPTQSYYENTIDKGLLEGLMLKRAKCTIYMAQEGDTLGKDSELAATLAQGKPVIAYVREIKGGELKKFAAELENRPLRYFRQRLLTLLADGFFDKPDNRQKVTELAAQLSLSLVPEGLVKEVYDVLRILDEFERGRRFQLIGDDDERFRTTHTADIGRFAKLFAAIESRAADNRADTIKTRHPLGMQVHLETGVGNGVLVARNEKQCADLVRAVLTRNLEFCISLLRDPQTTQVIGTVLLEKATKSRFRVVTKDECLTNSFWNFYLEEESPRSGK